MPWDASGSFQRAILHVDGDSFFASCEVAKNPALRGRPVITGRERGIASAMTYEAKARGVKRGMRIFEILRLYPEAIILPSDYETYSLFSRRMYAIVRRCTPSVEEYSIDECFADLTGLRGPLRMTYVQMAEGVKRDLELELGMTFSVGLSATKVLAKIGSKWNKPGGLTVIPMRDARKFLEKTPVEKIWGVGPNTSAYLNKFGVKSAWELASKDEAWVKGILSKPYVEIWKELNGEVVNELNTEGRCSYQSIAKTKTFTPPSKDANFVYSQLSKNIENACIKLRRWNLATSQISFFLKTQDFIYHGLQIKLPHQCSVPQDILKIVGEYFPAIFKKETLYRASGVTLMKLTDAATTQLDLFGSVNRSESLKKVFESVDDISTRHGKHTVFLGSSFKAMTCAAHLGERGNTKERLTNLFKGESKRRRLGIPMLGEVG